jgi:hypothetical protein
MRIRRARWRIATAGATVVVGAVLVTGMPPAGSHTAAVDAEVVLSRAAREWQRDATRLASEPVPPVAGSSQAVAVTVEAGPLAVVRAPAAMVLRRDPHAATLRGTARVLVADARGTSQGFVLRASVTRAAGDRARADDLTIRVQKVVVTADGTHGVRATSMTRVGTGAPVVLVRVAPRVGNGAFEVSFAVEAKAPHRGVDRVTVLPHFVVD